MERSSDSDNREGSHDYADGKGPAVPDHQGDRRRSKTSGFWSLVGGPVLCVICGLVFGFAMEKGRVFEPRIIRRQMVLNKFIMVKMFVSAVAMGLFGMSILAMLPWTHRRFMLACTSYYNSLADKGVLSSIVGGLMLGVGMTLSGSCPTSVFTQLGALVPNTGYTLAGALAATLVYGILKPAIDRTLEPEITDSSNPWISSPYFVMALPLVAMFGSIVCAFELLLPWSGEIKQKNAEDGIFMMKAWPPYVSGMIIGSLQVPLILGIGETLGGSSSLLTLLAQVLVGPLKKLSPFIRKYRWGFGSWWQIFYVGGVMCGAYLSASLSDSLGQAKGVPVYHAFIGGFLSFFGARIAGGCTSGHGLSGMGFLSIMSFIAVAAMFTGAVVTGFSMKAMDILKTPAS